MLSSGNTLRRKLGISFLVLAGSMLFWGMTALKSHLAGRAFLYYWLVCFLMTELAIVTAFLDYWAIRRESRKEHRTLINSTLNNLEEDIEHKPADTVTDERKLE